MKAYGLDNLFFFDVLEVVVFGIIMSRSFLRFCTVREFKIFYTVPDDINQNFFKFLLFVDYSLNLIIFFMSAGT